MSPRRFLSSALSAALGGLLAACGAPAATQPTVAPSPSTVPATVPPTAAPTAAPTASVAPTVAPTAAPAAAPTAAPTAEPAGALPQPLYILQGGQIFRIEADGATRTQITHEVPFNPDALAVIDFAVSPLDNTLVYVVQRDGPSALVRSGPNGEDPAPLFASDVANVGDPLFTPDGSSVAVRLQGPFEQPGSFQSGLYLIPITGGEPQLLLADDPIEDPATVSEAAGAAPHAFSPDGSRLLVFRFGQQLEVCDLAVLSVADGAVTELQTPAAPPMERQTSCGSGASWAPDGSAAYFTLVRIGAPGGESAIWRLDPATGAAEPVTAEQSGPFTLYFNPAAMADGGILALSAQAEALPEPFSDNAPVLSYSIVRLDPATGEATELRPAEPLSPILLAWDKGGAGAAVSSFDAETGASRLLWLPVGDAPALELSAEVNDLPSFAWSSR
jgi:hypothetical protein